MNIEENNPCIYVYLFKHCIFSSMVTTREPKAHVLAKLF